MKNIIVSNLAPINSNDLIFFMELERSLNNKGYKVFFWSCINTPSFKNYIQMSWDISKWERFGDKLSSEQRKAAHKLVDKSKWLPRIEKLVKQSDNDITTLYDIIVYNSYYLLISMDINIFFSWNNLCPHSGILNDMCAMKHIDTFLVERGNFPNTWYLEEGGLLGHSVIANKTQAELGITEEHYELGRNFIKNFKFDDFDKYKQHRDEDKFLQLQNLKSKAKKQNIPIIVMFPPDDGTIGFFPSEHEDRKKTLPYYENSFEAAKMIAKESGVLVIFKPHPSFIGWEYDLEELNNLFIVDYDYKYLIEYADIVASSGSGLGLIALANKKPLISMSKDILYGKKVAYEALEPSEIRQCVTDAEELFGFDKKLDNFYSFVGYMMKEYMISLSKDNLFSSDQFLIKNIKENQSLLKRLINAIF